MKPLALVRDFGRDFGSSARDFGSSARDFSMTALDAGWERRKTVLAVIGGAVLIAAAGVFVSRLLSKRAAALAEEGVDAAKDKLDGKLEDIGTGKFGKGAGSASTMAKAEAAK